MRRRLSDAYIRRHWDKLSHMRPFGHHEVDSTKCGTLVKPRSFTKVAIRASDCRLLELAGHAPKTCDDASFKANHRGPLKLPPVNLVAPSRCRRLFRLRGRSGDNRRIRSRIERSRRLRGHSGRNTSAVE